VLQLVDTTASEMFATVRNDTSELELQRITYRPIELPKKETQENEYPITRNSPLAIARFGANALGQQADIRWGFAPRPSGRRSLRSQRRICWKRYMTSRTTPKIRL